MTPLEGLLSRIEPLPDQADEAVSEAFNTFDMPGPVITRWDDYIACIAGFLCHIECGILRIQPDRPVHLGIDSSHCFALLKEVYTSSAPQATFEMARTGNEGGLLNVLRTIAEQLGREYAGNWIGCAVSSYWNPRSIQEKMDDIAEYIQLCGHLLPSELTEGSAGRIFVNFPKVLKEHPYLIRRMRRVGR
jgi:hypothetical protein